MKTNLTSLSRVCRFNFIVFCFLFALLSLPFIALGQVELVPVSHPVYDFLKRADLGGYISGYNSSSLPLSRITVANFLNDIKSNAGSLKLTGMDKKILDDYLVEFSYEIDGSLKKSSGIFQGGYIFDNDRQKYLYAFADSNVSFFTDVQGWYSYRQSDGDSAGHHSIGLVDAGFRLRGTVLNSVGFYLRVSKGQRIHGENTDVEFARITNPKWKSNQKMTSTNSNFDSYEGYIRYATQNELLALTIGKEQVTAGFGYVDKLFLSANPVPYSFARLDLKYKKIHYFFMYASLRGDSLGREMDSKYLVTHKLNLNLFENWKLGFFESLTVSDRPFNFTYLNPFSFIRSADYSAGSEQSGLNNAMIGLDMEVKPLRKLAVQGTMLIDDLDLGTLFSNRRGSGGVANDNRFGWQLGAIWTDGFFIPNLTAAVEYTRINPFVYTHRTNKSNYVHWFLPVGHFLQPNSEEIAVKLNYDITHRLNFKFQFQYQRHAEGLVFNGDTLIINYGGLIERGDSDVKIDNVFMNGNRIDIGKMSLSAVWQPFRQYYLEGNLVFRLFHLLYKGKSLNDVYGWFTLRIDL